MKTVGEYFLPMQNINSLVVSWKTIYLTYAIKRSYLTKHINKKIINLLLMRDCTIFSVITWIEFLKSVGYSESTEIQKTKIHHPTFHTNGIISGPK